MQKQRTLTKQWMQACLRCKGFTQLFFRNIFHPSCNHRALCAWRKKWAKQCQSVKPICMQLRPKLLVASQHSIEGTGDDKDKKPAKTRHFHTSRPGFLWEGASAAKAELPSEMTNHNQHNFRSIQVPGSSSVLFCNNVFKCKQQDLKGSTDAWKTMSIAALHFYNHAWLSTEYASLYCSVSLYICRINKCRLKQNHLNYFGSRNSAGIKHDRFNFFYSEKI